MVFNEQVIIAKVKKPAIRYTDENPIYVYAQIYHMDENYSHSGGKHALTGSIPLQGGKKYRIELRDSKSGKLNSGVKVSLIGKQWIMVN